MSVYHISACPCCSEKSERIIDEPGLFSVTQFTSNRITCLLWILVARIQKRSSSKETSYASTDKNFIELTDILMDFYQGI